MIDVEFLEWDSNFFIKKIGRINLNQNFTNKELVDQLVASQKERYKLIYLFNATKKNVAKKVLTAFNGELVDTKIVFQKEITEQKNTSTTNIKSYNAKFLDKALINLALLSGNYSRFNAGKYFNATDFKNLYIEWLANSINRTIADEVFIYKENNKIIGFVTVSIKTDIGYIGLIAIDPNYQGKQIGSQLIAKVENFLFSKNIKKLNVPTQEINSLACQFYLKNNFTILSSQKIYHFALK